MNETHLRFAPEILQRLGEELIPHPDLGIVELVRNAYDADATECVITLRNVNEIGGDVTILDNGDGMTVEQINSGWLLLGKSPKTSSKVSRTGRRRVGEKGLGRLGALRLGTRAYLKTYPRLDAGYATETISLELNWTDYEGVEAVEDVRLTIVSHEVEKRMPGTEITLHGLRQRMLPSDVRRLARSLVMLTGPFPGQNTFKARLLAPEFTEIERLVQDTYLGEYEYKIMATVDGAGRASAVLEDWRGKVVGAASHRDLVGRRKTAEYAGLSYISPPARFELYHFNLSKAGFDVRGSVEAYTAVQEWLRAVGGVHLFQRGLRVQPYGDPGYDWLDLNLRRARSPELRPSTNNSVGRIIVEDEQDLLIPKTDRTGFLENEPFAELKRFAGDVLEWAAGVRQDLRNRQREADRQRARDQVKKATEQVERSVKKLPEQVRPKVERAIEQYQAALGAQLRSVEDDLLLYRTLSTVGTTTAVFAHETLRPLAAIEAIAVTIQSRAQQDLPDTYEVRYAGLLDRLSRSASSMRTFAEIPLRMLTRRKRKRTIFDLNGVAQGVVDLFAPYVDDAGVKISLQLAGRPAHVRGSIASAEAILANLIANSIYFLGGVGPSNFRQVIIRTSTHATTVVLTVADSGPGLVGISPEEVWLPGRTTKEEGTGLGLTIVRDATRDMDGVARCTGIGELGGAEFHIELPLAEAN